MLWLNALRTPFPSVAHPHPHPHPHSPPVSVSSRFSSNTPSRGDFASVNEADVAHFRSFLQPSQVITDADSLGTFNQDWMKKYSGKSTLALKPKSTAEVSAILKYCNEKKLAVCPQGGNTGLVGGSVPVHDEVIVNLSLMNKVGELDSVSGIVSADAGVVLEDLDNFLQSNGFIAPLDLGAKGSCEIGGNISTNAGGIHLIYFGSLRGTVMGLEVVLADGTILDSMTALRKDNTGYDLKQLFIGAEGTLGLVTRVSLLCPPKPSNVNVALLGVKSFEDAQTLLKRAKSGLGEILSAFEFLDHTGHEMMSRHFGVEKFLDEECPIYVVMETMGSNEAHDSEKFSSFLEAVMEDGLVPTGTIAQDASQQKKIWFLRESLAAGCQAEGKAVYKYDVSLPAASMYSLVDTMKERFQVYPEVKVLGYGHLGDGNLHLNIVAPDFDQKYLDLIEPFVYKYTSGLRGSISAEHGIGVMKPDALHYSKTAPMITAMKQIKNVFDPKGILNPYKVLPED